MTSLQTTYRMFGTLRFALALAVVLSHTWFLTFGRKTETFVGAIGIGNVAVMGFFVLSGFIIAEAIDCFYRDRTAAFVGNRLLRLVPPYWAAVVVSVAGHALLEKAGLLKLSDYPQLPFDIMFTPENLAVQVTAIIPVLNFNNVLPNHDWYYFIRFAWAIFVEFEFYFAIAACVALRPLLIRWITNDTTYAALCIGGALAVHLYHELIHPLHSSFQFIPYFVLGLSLYAVVTRRSGLARICVTVCYGLVAIHFARYTQGLPPKGDWWSGLASPKVATPLAMMLAIPAVLFLLAPLTVSARTAARDQWLGDITYPLYLNHYVVVVVIYALIPAPGMAIQLFVVCASIALALTMKSLVERPMVPLRNRLRGRPVATPYSTPRSGQAASVQIAKTQDQPVTP